MGKGTRHLSTLSKAVALEWHPFTTNRKIVEGGVPLSGDSEKGEPEG